jgi:hypothetical protein
MSKDTLKMVLLGAGVVAVTMYVANKVKTSASGAKTVLAVNGYVKSPIVSEDYLKNLDYYDNGGAKISNTAGMIYT